MTYLARVPARGGHIHPQPRVVWRFWLALMSLVLQCFLEDTWQPTGASISWGQLCSYQPSLRIPWPFFCTLLLLFRDEWLWILALWCTSFEFSVVEGWDSERKRFRSILELALVMVVLVLMGVVAVSRVWQMMTGTLAFLARLASLPIPLRDLTGSAQHSMRLLPSGPLLEMPGKDFVLPCDAFQWYSGKVGPMFLVVGWICCFLNLSLTYLRLDHLIELLVILWPCVILTDLIIYEHQFGFVLPTIRLIIK